MESASTSLGIRCKDGVVLACEKLVTSKLMKAGANKRIATVDRNIGVVCYACFDHSNCLMHHVNIRYRFLLVSFLTANTSPPAPVKKQPSGVTSTKHQSPFHHSPTAWVLMFRSTPYITQYDHLASQRLLVVGMVRMSYQWMDK